jgi:hypothetical protein
VGKEQNKNIITMQKIQRTRMVSTRQLLQKEEHPPCHQGRLDSSQQGQRRVRAALVERCAVATKEQADAEDKEQEDVDLAAVGGVHHSDDSDKDVHDDEASVRTDFVSRGTKTTGDMEDDQQPEEEKNDDNKEMRITRLDIKSKSKMNDTDLCNFSTPN